MRDTDNHLKILYVDDEPVNLRLMRDVFSMVLKRPDAVVTATNGDDALRLVRDGAFDVVISDQRMPGMCGTELLARVREVSPRCARLILTGYPSDEEVTEALRSGIAQAIVSKPWKAKELEGTIKTIVARSH
jgi:response regulator RpfG family c-di-GMP phosphodiesterase